MENIKKIKFKINRFMLSTLFVGSFGASMSFAEEVKEDTPSEDVVVDNGKEYISITDDNNNVYITETIELSDGNIVSVGYTTSTATDLGFTNKGGYEAIIMKKDSTGKLLWLQGFTSTLDDYFYDVIETSDGGLVAVGQGRLSTTTSTNTTSYGIVVKYSAEGSLLWQKTTSTSGVTLYSVSEAYDGTLVAVGSTSSAGYLCLWDSAGTAGSAFTHATALKSVIATGKNSFIVSGTSSSYAYAAELIMVTASSTTSLVANWSNTFGGNGTSRFNHIMETSDNSIVAVGYSSSTNVSGFTNKGGYDAIIVKYDRYGKLLWFKTFGGTHDDYFNSVIETADGSYVTVGYSNSTDAGFRNEGFIDGLIFKYNKQGNVVWSENYGGFLNDYFLSINNASNNNLLISGYTNSANIHEIPNTGGYLGFHIRHSVFSKMEMGSFSEEEAEALVVAAEANPSMETIDAAREAVNTLLESSIKDYLQNRLTALKLADTGVLYDASVVVDVYVGFGTAISVSAKTNNISFENFSGVEDMKMESAINLTVSSSLPYKIESFITGDLTSADTEDVISTEIINIKASEAENFTAFLNAATPIVLVNNAPRGDDVPHSIDLLLKGGYMKTAGVYKTSLKFIASQL